MKIGILTGYYAPEIVAETHLLVDLANDFIRKGADVTVITGFPARGVDEQTRLKYQNISEEVADNGLRIWRVGPRSREGKGFISRTLRYLKITYVIYRKARKLKPDIYLISSTPPFLGFAGKYLTGTAPTVYNLQDLFPDSLINLNSRLESNMLIRFFRKFEKLIYKGNSHLLTISQDFRKSVQSRGIPEKKISVVYNWIDSNDIKPVKRDENKLFEKYNLDHGSFYITHCGNIGHSQNLEMVINTAKKLEMTHPDIRFVFIGDGARVSVIQDYIKEMKAGNVSILPYQSFEDLSLVFGLGDVSLVCAKRGVSSGLFPSKTWSIMSAGRAVLCSFDESSELCSIIRTADCGICIPPENEEDFKNAVISLYNDRERTVQYGINGRQYILQKLTREYGTSEYYRILKEISNHRD